LDPWTSINEQVVRQPQNEEELTSWVSN